MSSVDKAVVVGSTGVGSLPLVVGLGAACEAMSKRGMASVEKRIVELRDRACEGLTKISKIQIVSPPPGPLTSALVSYKLPDSIAGNVFRERLQKKYRIVLKVSRRSSSTVIASRRTFSTPRKTSTPPSTPSEQSLPKLRSFYWSP